MTNVEFEEETNNFTSRRILGEEVVPGMVKILTRAGVAKDSKQAEYILLGIVGMSLIATFAVFSIFVFKGEESKPKQNLSEIMPTDHPPVKAAKDPI